MTETSPVADSPSLPGGYSERLSLLIHKLGVDLLERTAGALAGLELTERQYLALAVLATDEPGSQHELGKLMGLAPQIVVSLTDSLEDRGLVTRRTNPLDRRRTMVELTGEGRRILAKADKLAESAEKAVFADLSERDRRELHETLRLATRSSDSGLSSAQTPA